MNAVVKLQPAADASLIEQVEVNPQIVLLDEGKRKAFFELVKVESAKAGADVSTKEGRDAIRKAAAKIASTRSAIDAERLSMTKGWREQTKAVNEVGSDLNDQLEVLQKAVRKPLTDYEQAEKDREDTCRRIEARLDAMAVVALSDTSDTVAQRLAEILALESDLDITEVVFRERFEGAVDLQAKTIATLQGAIERLKREEADQAELAQLRAMAAEQRAKDEAEANRRDLVQRTRDHIRNVGRGFIGDQQCAYALLIFELEAKVSIDERFGADSIELEILRVETLKNLNDALERQRIEDSRLAAEQAAEQARREEQTAASAREAERLSKEQAERDEADRRAQDQEHRAAVLVAVQQALMEHAHLDRDEAVCAALAIADGQIPHTTISF